MPTGDRLSWNAEVGHNRPMKAASHRPAIFWIVQAITSSRLPMAGAFVFVALRGEAAGVAPSTSLLLLLLAGELSDVADGFLARHFGVVSPWGELFDPYIDSLSRLVVYWGLARAGWVVEGLPLVMAMRDITVAYARLILDRSGASVAARWSGKAKAWVQGLGALLATLSAMLWQAPGAVVWGISMIVAAVTAWSAFDYGLAARKASR